MVKPESRETVSVFHVSFLCASFLFYTVAVTSVLFFLSATVSWLNVALSVLFTLGTFFYSGLIRLPYPEKIKAVMIAAFLILLAVVYSIHSFDFSFDGNAYHKQAVGLLRDGWNPVYQTSESFNTLSGSTPYNAPSPLKWAESYPKSTWYFASCLYAVTNNIESGKAVTIIAMVITFGLFYDYFSCKKLAVWQTVLLPLLAAANPIALAQHKSYYIDGFVCCSIMNLMLLFSAYFDEEYKRNRIQLLYLIISLVIVGGNTKFSALFFIGSISITFFVIYWIFYKKQKLAIPPLKMFLIFAIMAAATVFVAGYSPFVTNILRYQNPFYGFFELVGGQSMVNSGAIEGLSNFQMFWASLFGKMSQLEYRTLAEMLKIPFTVYPGELNYYFAIDTRIGGMGVLFSGIFAASCVALILYLVKIKKSRPPLYAMAFIAMLAVVSIEISVIPATFQARYIGFIYILPIAVLFLIFQSGAESRAGNRAGRKAGSKKKKSYYLGCFMASVMMLNVAPWGMPVIRGLQESAKVRTALQGMGEDNQKIEVALIHKDSFTGLWYNLRDYHVNYTVVDLGVVDATFRKTYGQWIFYRAAQEE